MEKEIKYLKFCGNLDLQILHNFIEEGKKLGANHIKYIRASDPMWDDDRLVLIKVFTEKEELNNRLNTLNSQIKLVEQELLNLK